MQNFPLYQLSSDKDRNRFDCRLFQLRSPGAKFIDIDEEYVYVYLCVRGNVFMLWIFTRSLVSRNEITFSRAKKPRESNRRRRVALKQDLSVSASCVNRDNVSYRYLAKNEIKTWTSLLASSRIFFFNVFNQRESEKFLIIKIYDLLNL